MDPITQKRNLVTQEVFDIIRWRRMTSAFGRLFSLSHSYLFVFLLILELYKQKYNFFVQGACTTTGSNQCSGGSSTVGCYETGSICTPCPIAKYCDTNGGCGTTGCTACGSGTYSTFTYTPGTSGSYGSGPSASTSCVNTCPSGSYVSSQKGVATNAGASQCQQCGAGYYCTDTVTRTACAPGKYSSTATATAASTCTNCVAGKYGLQYGATAEAVSCISCPSATSNSVAGDNKCACNAGYSSDFPTGASVATSGSGTVQAMTNVGNYRILKFTAGSTTLTVTGVTIQADILMVGGGGGGGYCTGSGGGAGGIIYKTLSLAAGTYVVTVGGGGSGGLTSPTTQATSGGDTTITTTAGTATGLTAGGGTGGTQGASGGNCGSCGTSCYGANIQGTALFTTQSSSTSIDSSSTNGIWETGGGCGAGGAGDNAAVGIPGMGGPGLQFDILMTGTATWYGGGGGGAWNYKTKQGAVGGLGGGGSGGTTTTTGSPTAADAGHANTGGGGGGANNGVGCVVFPALDR